jgi:hypothetical protein
MGQREENGKLTIIPQRVTVEDEDSGTGKVEYFYGLIQTRHAAPTPFHCHAVPR